MTKCILIILRFSCGFYIGKLLKGQANELARTLARKSEILISRAGFATIFLLPANIAFLQASVFLSVHVSSNLFACVSKIYLCPSFDTYSSLPSVFSLFRVQTTLFCKKKGNASFELVGGEGNWQNITSGLASRSP